MKGYKVYIAGPMRGYDKYNFPAFDRAAARIEDRFGWETVNPADLDRAVGVDETTDPLPEGFMAGAMRRDLKAIAGECAGIVLLPGWEASSGVEVELAAAKACGLDVYFYDDEHAGWAPDWTLAPTTYEKVERRKAGAFGQVTLNETRQAVGLTPIQETPGVVRTFTTGATRDVDQDKYDFEGFLSPAVLMAFGEYMHEHRHLKDGSLRASDNWQKGIPRDVYMKSLIRHMLDLWMLHRGLDAVRPETGEAVDFDESLAALMFNVQGYWHEYLKDQAQKEAA